MIEIATGFAQEFGDGHFEMRGLGRFVPFAMMSPFAAFAGVIRCAGRRG